MLNAEQTEKVMKAMQSLRMSRADVLSAAMPTVATSAAELQALTEMADYIQRCILVCENLQTDLVPAEL